MTKYDAHTSKRSIYMGKNYKINEGTGPAFEQQSECLIFFSFQNGIKLNVDR